jgi:hypothetical protein
MEMHNSPVRSTALELNGGEGGGPVARGAALSSGEAPRSMHEDGKRVRQLDTDSMAETEARCGGGGLPEVDKSRWCGRNAIGGGHPLYACVQREGDGMARARCAAHGCAQTVRACTRGCRAQRGRVAAGACVEVTP